MRTLKKSKKKIFILSISSDIGYELAVYWINKGHNVYGTFKNFSDKCKILKKKRCRVIQTRFKKKYKYPKFF